MLWLFYVGLCYICTRVYIQNTGCIKTNNTFEQELQSLRKYIQSSENEDAKRTLLYPLFAKLFKDKFNIESNANGADGYVEGQLIIEAKTNFNQWIEAFFQALHYKKKFGLAYNTIYAYRS